jgi:hypothetical protein
LEGLAMSDVGIFYDHFVYFSAKWHILWRFGTFGGGHLYIFFRFWYIVPRKIWQP